MSNPFETHETYDPSYTMLHGQPLLPHVEDTEPTQLPSTGKRNTSCFDIPPEAPKQPKRKRKRSNNDNDAKRHKYDVLQAFFRVYFVRDPEAAVAKEAIFNLYTTKIPEGILLARNAMYRHMWSFFGKDICVSQSNYREYVKGLKMITKPTHGVAIEKDFALLQQNGISDFYEFSVEDLLDSGKSTKDNSKVEASVPPNYTPGTIVDSGILEYVEQLETQALSLAKALTDLKEKLQNNKSC